MSISLTGLNHYIGMKTLHTEDFIEFKILPYIIGALATLTFIAGLINRKKIFFGLVIVFIVTSVLTMADFWRWEYNYGHNLNPEAAIIVPGMAYQPPLIGYKQLLNFAAYSIPDSGGWIYVGRRCTTDRICDLRVDQGKTKTKVSKKK
jgi:copper chaperone NosL